MHDVQVTRVAHFFCELVGMALVVFVGLSAIAVFFGIPGAVVALPNEWMRIFLATLVFCVFLISLVKSPIGKISGCHLNPATSFAFYLEGLLKLDALLIYVAGQILGATLGAYLFEIAWASVSASIHFGVPLPAATLSLPAVAGIEAMLTCGSISLAFYFMHHERVHPYCPYVTAIYLIAMKLVAASFTGAGMNPARALGPSFVAGDYRTVFAYVIGPLLGAAAAHLIHRIFGLKRPKFHKFGHAEHGEHYLMNLLGRPYHYVHDHAHFPLHLRRQIEKENQPRT